MSTRIDGDTAYELLFKDENDPLTEAQAEAMVTEYEKLGLLYKKSMWKGLNCVITKAPAAEYLAFIERIAKDWESIRERIGYSGLLYSNNNTYDDRAMFTPDAEWQGIIDLINANF